MVCTANVCRSPMAEVVATQIAQRNGLSQKFRFESAGTHANKSKMRIDSRAVAVLERRGYAVKKMRSKPIEKKDFQRFDFILAMDNTNYSELQRICPPELQHKLKMFLAESKGVGSGEVPDPYYGNSEGFERVLDLCETGVQGLLRSTLA
ncbi:low molecular weight protein-tyrosine-phosphatase [Rhodoferax sp.]|uniref:low molecular weight protein-tyrosine-phosphatase n=1 Tax=Rhodoferax sp. TaxID=50421 RepID=UPI0025FB4508|nr:low molecular weight protein-tyrosine-phosphatase [Rhodoferax sp.]